MEYRVIDKPELPPGCCFLARTDVGPFIDTGLDVDDLDPIGRIYLAESTVSDLAQHLGFAPPVASARARDRITELEAELADAHDVIDGLVKASEAFKGVTFPRPTEVVTVPPGAPRDVLLWVSDSDDFDVVIARAQAARDAELAEAEPRRDLLEKLDTYLLRKGEYQDAYQKVGDRGTGS